MQVNGDDAYMTRHAGGVGGQAPAQGMLEPMVHNAGRATETHVKNTHAAPAEAAGINVRGDGMFPDSDRRQVQRLGGLNPLFPIRGCKQDPVTHASTCTVRYGQCMHLDQRLPPCPHTAQPQYGSSQVKKARRGPEAGYGTARASGGADFRAWTQPYGMHAELSGRKTVPKHTLNIAAARVAHRQPLYGRRGCAIAGLDETTPNHKPMPGDIHPIAVGVRLSHAPFKIRSAPQIDTSHHLCLGHEGQADLREDDTRSGPLNFMLGAPGPGGNPRSGLDWT